LLTACRKSINFEFGRIGCGAGRERKKEDESCCREGSSRTLLLLPRHASSSCLSVRPSACPPGNRPAFSSARLHPTQDPWAYSTPARPPSARRRGPSCRSGNDDLGRDAEDLLGGDLDDAARDGQAGGLLEVEVDLASGLPAFVYTPGEC
jgi:hypothetical protein